MMIELICGKNPWHERQFVRDSLFNALRSGEAPKIPTEFINHKTQLKTGKKVDKELLTLMKECLRPDYKARPAATTCVDRSTIILKRLEHEQVAKSTECGARKQVEQMERGELSAFFHSTLTSDNAGNDRSDSDTKVTTSVAAAPPTAPRPPSPNRQATFLPPPQQHNSGAGNGAPAQRDDNPTRRTRHCVAQ